MTYTTLLAAILGWIRNPEAEQDFPTFISLAEAKMSRILAEAGITGALKRSDASIDTEYVGLPADLGRAMNLVLSTGDILEKVSPEVLERWRSEEDADPALPVRFAVVGREMRLYPVPNASYTAELTYQATLDPLGPSTPTNWVLDSHPDAYLYGALVQAGGRIGEEPRLDSWAQLFSSAMAEVIAAERAKGGQQTNRLRTDFPLQGQTFNINTGV
jgi:hypothetical protein